MILTENAALDDKTNEDYWDMCDELRISVDETGKVCNLSWDKFVLRIGSFRFKAQWANWRSGKANLQWDMKNDLRRAVGLPELPKPVQQVLEEHVSENAKISIGISSGEFQEMVASGQWATHVLLSNEEQESYSKLYEKVSKPKQKKRIGIMRPTVPIKYDEWRKKLGRSWVEVVQAGLLSIERGDVDGKLGKGGRLNGH